MLSDDYLLIDNTSDLEKLCKKITEEPWICFDTEFIGEKRFLTKLCLIQIATADENFLIDPLGDIDLTAFLGVITNPNVMKITHAGENDYRLLYQSYGILPKNTFDTQIAAGFLGYKYPISFKKLVFSELGRRLAKGYTVADWESRPVNDKQLHYALNDVIPLTKLYPKMVGELDQHQRMDWAKSEFSKLETADYYYQDPNKEALNNNLMQALKEKERLFLLRLINWRRDVAQAKDYSKEMVLPNRYFGHIVRNISSGIDALKQNRRIPNKIVDRHWDVFNAMYQEVISDNEREILNQIPQNQDEDPQQELLLDYIYLIGKQRALENNVAIELLFPKSWVKLLRSEPERVGQYIQSSWRKNLLGEEMTNWFSSFSALSLSFQGNKLEVVHD